ncbi:hypothetical protein yc1106_01696 [Curvularia clavata]|uniref:Ricin B lectin domain-containing protein n=1 Tax=Curvularia clavata TaxID=95742 RepID=A0A9Q9DPD7_CURCL|nr:hypothetical protein yc1106_01696 [Curvularia clavata]
MSDFTGPGIYTIVPFHAQDRELDVWGNATAAGTPLKLYKKTPGAPNHQFLIVDAGGANCHPEKGDREYLIIAVNSGLYLTAGAEGKGVTMELRAPKDGAIHWKLAHAGNGAFYINHASDSKQLNIRGGGKDEGTEVITYGLATSANCQFLLKFP